MIAVAMDRWRKAQQGEPHTTRSQRRCSCSDLRGKLDWAHLVPLPGGLALKEQGPGSDDQRALRTREAAPSVSMGASIRLGGRRRSSRSP